jgi:hypothetical protein
MSIWQNSTKSLPKKPDDQTVRVTMEQDDISGRKSHLPKEDKSGPMTVEHVGKSSGAMR